MATRGFRAITGHEDVIGHFRSAIAHGRISHAYLITGESGSGKRSMADAFAAALLCTSRRGFEDESASSKEARPAADGINPVGEDPARIDACLTCPSCRKLQSRNHPDVFYVTHEKPGVLTVGEIREQVIDTVGIRPYESDWKVYIIADADKMNVQAQNAVLKTIEEPPAYAVFLLLAASPEALLPTIRSRCVQLSLKPVPDRFVEEYLIRELQIKDHEAHVLTAFAQGNVGRARAAAEDETFSGMKDSTVHLIKTIHEMDTARISEAVRQMKEVKEQIYDILDIILMWFRDVLYFKATADIDRLVFSDEISAIRAQAAASSYEGLQSIVEAADRCRVRLMANVNFELALELLLLTIKEKSGVAD